MASVVSRRTDYISESVINTFVFQLITKMIRRKGIGFIS
jgi:hypothetical protein